MKRANNNEVDLLLRSLAKGRSTPQNDSGNGTRTAIDHLDADELNSYAEGLVPEAARTRYAAHLADCDSCRGIVVGLTQAAGMSPRAEVAEQKGRPIFWQKFSAFFSPAVLRYAVPMLVLTAVIAIGLVALREPRQAEFVAKNEPTVLLPQPNPTVSTESSTANTPRNDGSLSKDKTDSREVSAVDGRVENEKAKPSEVGAVSEAKKLDRADASLDDAKSGAPTSLYELQPAPPPAAKSAATAPTGGVFQSDVDRNVLAKDLPAKRENEERSREVFRNQQADEHGPNRAAAPRSGPSAGASQRAETMTTGRGGPYASKKGKVGEDNEENVEMRTVSGRRFAHDRNRWVDTAYDSARATIKVNRGSEQFRALIADEPGLGTIARQLDGVVIVVWKGRAYLIQ